MTGISRITKEGHVSRKTGKRRHIPQRTCIACREVLSKRSMIRIVHSSQGVVIDPTGKMAGRGAYIHQRRSCWERGMKGALASALKVDLTSEEREQLMRYALSLPENESS
jgi:uncharacterized protein